MVIVRHMDQLDIVRERNDSLPYLTDRLVVRLSMDRLVV